MYNQANRVAVTNYGIGVERPMVVKHHGTTYHVTFRYQEGDTARVTAKNIDTRDTSIFDAKMKGHEWLQRAVIKYFANRQR